MDTATPHPGDRYLGPTGVIWTVVGTTPRGDRVHVVTDGDAGAVIDLVALARMLPLDAPRVELTVVPEPAPAPAAADDPATAA